MASGDSQGSAVTQAEKDKSDREKRVSELLEDKDARDLMIEKLRESGHVAATSAASGVFAPPMLNGSSDSSGAYANAIPFRCAFSIILVSSHPARSSTPPWFRKFVGPAWFRKFAGPGGGGE